ncbi:carboxymuconolactone decarboxylase family protein [Nocardioides salsibiostraticola]
MSDAWGIGGATALSLYAPDAAAAFTEMVRVRPTDLNQVVFESMRAATAHAIDLTPLPGARVVDVPPLGVVAFAEQFAVDVSIIDDEIRTDWASELGRQFVSATQMVFVADYGPRVRTTLDALFGRDEWFEPPMLPVDDAWPVIENFTRAVARLRVLDDLTTELVRLRGARQHECRLCMSRRSLAAVEQGADAETFADIDDYRSSTLSDRAQAALGLTDAIIWTPATMRPRDLAAAREHLSPAEAVEVVLDVARNATNKIAVSLAADEAENPTKVALFEVDDNGNLTFP